MYVLSRLLFIIVVVFRTMMYVALESFRPISKLTSEQCNVFAMLLQVLSVFPDYSPGINNWNMCEGEKVREIESDEQTTQDRKNFVCPWKQIVASQWRKVVSAWKKKSTLFRCNFFAALSLVLSKWLVIACWIHIVATDKRRKMYQTHCDCIILKLWKPILCRCCYWLAQLSHSVSLGLFEIVENLTLSMV